ncbi:hypothetical protein V5799_015424 [Amblyomma americanum]|uniref:Uncharacterized protein n=1 Tax=Amblyomma americanum TaxID=6943 RepID=A0AAQ4F7S3_AMBAM
MAFELPFRKQTHFFHLNHHSLREQKKNMFFLSFDAQVRGAKAILNADELGNALKSGQLQLTSTSSLRPPVPWRETQMLSTCTDHLTITEGKRPLLTQL